jgi:TonB family protein
MSEALESTHGQVSAPDRRTHARRRPSSLTYIEIDRENGGIVLDACEGGVSVQAVVSITEEELPQVRLKLPDSSDWLEMRARVIWTRESRKVAGLQFEELSAQSRAQLNDWLSRDASANAGQIVHAAAPAIAAEATETEAIRTEAAPTGTAQTEAAQIETAQIEAPETKAVQTEAVQTEAANSNASPAPSETEPEFEPEAEPAPAFVTDQSASDSWEPGLPEALEDFVPDATILAAPLTLGQETEVRIEKRETHPAHMLEGEIAPVPARAEDKFRVSSVYLLLFVLALVSLTAGWAAGRGKFGSIAHKFRALLQSKAPAAPAFEMQAGTPASPVNEIEIVDASNQHWAIPLHAPIATIGPLRAHQATVRTPASLLEPALNFQIWTLTAPKRSASSHVAEVAPPAVNERQGAPEIAPLGAGPVAPSGYTVPKPGISTGELKRGELLHRVNPEYPALARDQRVSGTVVLEANVAPDGAVRNVKVISGPQLLIPAATNAVRQWRYAPTLLDGEPIETQVRISLVFHLPSGGQ